ncbi:hypothetical protein [Chitinimonas sp.]|uniref:hypothetical protein n=1 Tax=Chitinimonas sp. TaxID=1934313 RepID=UPI0035AF14D2
MTIVQIQLWQLLTAVGAIAAFFIATVAGMGRLYFGLYERRVNERFDGVINKLTEEGDGLKRLERDFMNFKADLPIAYVRREDYIRGQSVIEAKLDALYSEVKLVQIKGGNKI